MDFGRKAQYFTLDVISDAGYREPFGYLATDSDVHGYIEETEKVFTSALMVTIFPWLNWVLRLPIVQAALPSEKDPLGLGRILGYIPSMLARDDLLTFEQHHQGRRRKEIRSKQESTERHAWFFRRSWTQPRPSRVGDNCTDVYQSTRVP